MVINYNNSAWKVTSFSLTQHYRVETCWTWLFFSWGEHICHETSDWFEGVCREKGQAVHSNARIMIHICYFVLSPKFLFMSLSHYIVFSSLEPAGHWPWQNCTARMDDKSTPLLDTFQDSAWVWSSVWGVMKWWEENILEEKMIAPNHTQTLNHHAIKPLVSLRNFILLLWKKI